MIGLRNVLPKQSEETLRILSQAIAATGHGVIIADATQPDFPVIYSNGAFEEITGYSRAEVLGRNCRFLQGPDTDPAACASIRQALQDRQECRVVLKNYRKDGTPFWNELTVSPVQDEMGLLTHFVGIQNDVTERIQTEGQLRASEERFRQVISSISDHIYVSQVSDDGRHLNSYLSPHLENLTGYPLEKALADWTFWPSTIIHPDDQAIAAAHAAYLAQGYSAEIEYRLVRADGRVIWVRDSARVVDEAGVRTIYGLVSDITERKQAEEVLRQQAAQIHRRNRELSLLNQVIAASAAGQEPENFLEIVCYELALAFDVPEVAAALLSHDKTNFTIVAEYQAKSQASILNQVFLVEGNPAAQYLLNHKTPLVADNALSDPRLAPFYHLIHQRGTTALLILPLIIEGEVIGLLGLNLIQTHTFSIEEINLAWSVADQVAGALARTRHGQARRLLSAAIEQSAESIIITDAAGIIIYVNSAFEKVSHYSRAEVLGQNPRILQSGRHETAFYRELWHTITAGRNWRGRFINKRKDGNLVTEDAIITPVRDEMGVIVNYVALQRDISRELQLEEHLRQSQKMEAIGRLAGGVAHDFNNLLTIIIGQAEYLLNSYYNADDLRREEIERIRKAGERAALLTRQLLTFSRQQPSQPQLLNLNQIVTNLEDMLRRLIGEHITVVADLDTDLGYIKADPGQIEQIIMNLAINARDAMPDGGNLTLKTTQLELAKKDTDQFLNVTPGPYVLLAIADTGVGMDLETKSRIFEPFFTTKALGKGTGLGLAIVYGIVEQNGGHIQVDSASGQGTTFKIYLPQTEQPLRPAPLPEASSVSIDGNETILLVEDEAGVRLVTSKFLQKQGYTVLEASHATEALQICQQYKGQFDLFIIDVVMPDMTGPELVQQLTQLYPNLKVCYISGYADDILPPSQAENLDYSLIEKPFTSELLVRKVREVLDKPQPYRSH